jgi:glucokinase
MKACVDIGGTKVAVSLAHGRELSHRQAEPTIKSGPPDALARQIIRMVHAACAEAGIAESDVQALGVSACGPFELKDGLVELTAPNICGGIAGPARGLPNDWPSAPLEEPLRRAFASVRIDNDALASLEAERRWGALQGVDHCAYVTWSTGIGAAVCVDGHVLRGKNGNAGHAGHMWVCDKESAALCGCGNGGDVESLVAGNAIPRRFGVDAAQLFDAAQAGDAHALAVVDGLCRVMGRMVHNLVVTLDLQAIALGGSVFWHQQHWVLPRLRAQLRGGPQALTRGVQLLPAGLGPAVGDHAALALVS